MERIITNQTAPKGAIITSCQDVIKAYQPPPGPERADLGIAEQVDDNDDRAPLSAWWKDK